MLMITRFDGGHSRILALTALMAFCTWVRPTSVISPVAAQSPTTPNYTFAQATEGKSAYAEHCESCHGQHLDDGEFAPPLKGADFQIHWGGQSAGVLFTYLSTKMPPARAGALGDEVYVQLLAYLLQENGLPPGQRALISEGEALNSMMLPGAPLGISGGLAAGVVVPPPPPRNSPLDKIRPVTDALLNNPPDGDWLTWRRTTDGLGFSPLKQINKSNIGNLRIAWGWTLPNGPNTVIPLVHDGVMFLQGFGDKVQALDAANGDLLWQYSRRLPKGTPASVKRSVAIFGQMLYLPTSDAHIVALDIKNGKVAWDHAVGDLKAGFRMNGGPLVVKNKVIVGTTGRGEGGNYLVALDANTGQEAWRFYTIARPDEQGGNSWNGLSLENRNGGSLWVPATYDPVLKLAFFGPAPTYDTAPLRDRVAGKDVTNDALYTDSTVALDPETGKRVWHFQHQPNNQWDLDWAFERQILNLHVNGTVKRVVVTGGKMTIFDILEADSGKYLFSFDLGLQNVVTAIDPKTGDKTVDPTLVPGDGETKMICPHVTAGRSWLPTSLNSSTKILYVPMVEACMDLRPVAAGARGNLSTGVAWTLRPRPNSDGKYGRLEAINLESRKVVWMKRQRAPQTTGILATAGDLIFAGALDRVFSAYDAATGQRLWSTRLNDVPSSGPITYTVNGKQYVAVVVGNGSLQAGTFPVLVPEMQIPANPGAAVWVFELPGGQQISANLPERPKARPTS